MVVAVVLVVAVMLDVVFYYFVLLWLLLLLLLLDTQLVFPFFFASYFVSVAQQCSCYLFILIYFFTINDSAIYILCYWGISVIFPSLSPIQSMNMHKF